MTVNKAGVPTLYMIPKQSQGRSSGDVDLGTDLILRPSDIWPGQHGGPADFVNCAAVEGSFIAALWPGH